VWWLENDILAVHHHPRLAHGKLIEAIQGMADVKTHQYAVLSPNGESVTMMPIRKNMPMSSTTTKALAATAMVVPCVKEGENCFEDEDDWKDTMEEHGVKDQDRQKMVHEARDKELTQKTVEGRKGLRGGAGREQGQIGGAGTVIGKDSPAVVRAALNGGKDFAGRHGLSGNTHRGTPAAYLGELAGTR
jgi:hypothetical protein